MTNRRYVVIYTRCRCGLSSSGRAPPCQGGGSEFEPRRPLQKPIAFAIGFFIRGYGGIGRHAGFRFLWETVQVQVLLPAPPRQNKAIRSCGGTSAAASTDDLVFPFPSQTHSVGLCDGFVSHLDRPNAPRQNKAIRSCGGTSTATSTDDLVFLFPSQTHFAGLCDRGGSDLDCPDVPRQNKAIKSCGGTSTAASTDDLVFPYMN